jgi:hypothetical protein
VLIKFERVLFTLHSVWWRVKSVLEVSAVEAKAPDIYSA